MWQSSKKANKEGCYNPDIDEDCQLSLWWCCQRQVHGLALGGSSQNHAPSNLDGVLRDLMLSSFLARSSVRLAIPSCFASSMMSSAFTGPALRRSSRNSFASRLAVRPSAPCMASLAKARHQPLDGAAGNREAFSPQLPPDLPHAVDAEVLREDPLNLDLQFRVPLPTGRTLAGVDPLGDMRMVGRRGDRQHLADRLDPIRFPVIIAERDHGLNPRSSFAWAKYADALRRISFACRSSRFSRSKAFCFSALSVGTPARLPLSTSAFFTHSRSVCAVQPILAETETIVAHRDGCSCSRSRTSRTARERISGENLLLVCLLMAPPSQELEPPINPGRFKALRSSFLLSLRQNRRSVRSRRSVRVPPPPFL